jgi:hypothetical protein
MNPPKFVPVYTAEGNLAGEMIRLLLESFGIQSILLQESAGAAYGFTVGPMGEVTIMVAENQAEDARQLILAMERGDLEIPPSPEGNEPQE